MDSGVPGQAWPGPLRLVHDGNRIAAATRTTNADGEATVNLRGVPNPQGPDTFSGRARNSNSAETCAGKATL